MLNWRFLALLLGGASCFLSANAAVAAPVRAALLPIAVHSGDEGSAYLSAGLAEMLSARLEQSGGVSVVLVPGQPVATSEVAKAIEAGRAAGVDYVVFGAFTQFGAGASLDVQCAAVNGAGDPHARRIFVQSGTLGEIIPKLDDLAAKIVRYMAGGEPRGPVATGGEASGAGELGEIRRRIEKLERTVFSQPGSSPDAAAAPAAQPAGASKVGSAR